MKSKYKIIYEHTMEKLIFLILLLLMSSCNSAIYKEPRRTVINFFADNEFSDIEKTVIKNALVKWQKVTSGFVTLTVKFVDLVPDPNWRTDGRSSIYKSTGGWKRTLALSLHNKPFWGLTMPDSGDIFIVEINSSFERLILHEVGHALIKSDWHSGNKRSVMWQYLGPNITEDDIYKILYGW